MPSRSSATKKSNFIDQVVSPVGIVALLVIMMIVSGGIYLYARRATITTVGKAKPTPTPTPTPIRLRPDDGVKGTYAISQGKHDGPTVSQIIFDPLDVGKGQQLTIDVKITNTAPIQKVTGSLQMDHGTQDVLFERINGTELNGVWQTKMTLQDTVLYTYILKITATSTNGTNTIGTAPRSR